MRIARLRRDSGRSDGTYYHIINRAVGTREDRPFGDLEKEKLVELISLLGKAYTIEVIGFCVMSNHYHIVLFAPHELPSKTEASRRWRTLYGDKPEPGMPEDVERWRNRLRDISDFTSQLQVRFTCWYNRTRPIKRRGTIWADRFKSVILEGNGKNSAVWSCLKYIELNPVRAKIVGDSADYRWCSWGRYCGSGKHPFAGNFTRHLKRLRGASARKWKASDVYGAFRSELARTMAVDRKANAAEVGEVAESAKRAPSPWVRADRRVRFWSDGAAIGSKSFVQEIYGSLRGEERAQKRRYGRGKDATDECASAFLYAMRSPRE